MILEFSVTNFRSIREKQTFSMLAYGSQSKLDNTFEVELTNGDKVRLLKTAGIYGANASGKSNLIRALFNLQRFIINTSNIEIDKPIYFYNPFLFNAQNANSLTEFELYFIHEKIKYRYYIAFNGETISQETLDYYPNTKKKNIFIRPFKINEKDTNLHTGRLSKDNDYKVYEVFKKLPLLSIFGRADNYHTQISPIFSYLKNIEIWNILDSIRVELLKNEIATKMDRPENLVLKKKLDKLIKVADTKIDKIIFGTEKTTITDNDGTEREITKRPIKQVFGNHAIYNNQLKVDDYSLPFREESSGTNMLFAIGGLIIEALDKGKFVVFDEIDTSLHPRLSRFLISLFHHPVSNPKNAQLIFTTHEANILDKNNMRADQIWFAEKNNFGETIFYSAQDFDGIREDIPFDKWYLAGKFGAIPNIQELEFIFGKDEE